MIFGINTAHGLNPQNASQTESKTVMTFDEQIEAVKKLKDLLDVGILTQDEFDSKKRKILGV